MIETILKLLGAGLQLWGDKEKHKYIDKMLELKKEWHEEYSKPVGVRDNVRLDRIDRELCQLCDTFASAVGAEGSGS